MLLLLSSEGPERRNKRQIPVPFMTAGEDNVLLDAQCECEAHFSLIHGETSGRGEADRRLSIGSVARFATAAFVRWSRFHCRLADENDARIQSRGVFEEIMNHDPCAATGQTSSGSAAVCQEDGHQGVMQVL